MGYEKRSGNVVLMTWGLSEELVSKGYVSAAISLLNGLLERVSFKNDVLMEVKTRLRLGRLYIKYCWYTDARWNDVKRILEDAYLLMKECDSREDVSLVNFHLIKSLVQVSQNMKEYSLAAKYIEKGLSSSQSNLKFKEYFCLEKVKNCLLLNDNPEAVKLLNSISDVSDEFLCLLKIIHLHIFHLDFPTAPKFIQVCKEIETFLDSKLTHDQKNDELYLDTHHDILQLSVQYWTLLTLYHIRTQNIKAAKLSRGNWAHHLRLFASSQQRTQNLSRASFEWLDILTIHTIFQYVESMIARISQLQKPEKVSQSLTSVNQNVHEQISCLLKKFKVGYKLDDQTNRKLHLLLKIQLYSHLNIAICQLIQGFFGDAEKTIWQLIQEILFTNPQIFIDHIATVHLVIGLLFFSTNNLESATDHIQYCIEHTKSTSMRAWAEFFRLCIEFAIGKQESSSLFSQADSLQQQYAESNFLALNTAIKILKADLCLQNSAYEDSSNLLKDALLNQSNVISQQMNIEIAILLGHIHHVKEQDSTSERYFDFGTKTASQVGDLFGLFRVLRMRNETTSGIQEKICEKRENFSGKELEKWFPVSIPF